MKKFNRTNVEATVVEITNPRNSKVDFAKKLTKDAAYTAGVQIVAGVMLCGARAVTRKVAKELSKRLNRVDSSSVEEFTEEFAEDFYENTKEEAV